MKDKITPSVLIDGETVPFEGWMFVLAFALKGIPWAVEKANDPEFNLRGKMQEYYKERDTVGLEAYIRRLEKDLEKAKEDYDNY